MNRLDKWYRELSTEWNFHNSRHRCYYGEGSDSGVTICPSELPNFRAFLVQRGFPVEFYNDRISGQDFDRPNFRSENEMEDFPVGNSEDEKPVSIRQLRERDALRANRGIRYRKTTAPTRGMEVLRDRSERARNAPLSDDGNPWEVEAMEYFKERLDEIQESVVRALGGIMAEQSRHRTLLDDILDSVNGIEQKIDDDAGTASRVAVEPSLTITLQDVPSDIAATLQDELQTRVERLVQRRAGS